MSPFSCHNEAFYILSAGAHDIVVVDPAIPAGIDAVPTVRWLREPKSLALCYTFNQIFLENNIIHINSFSWKCQF